MVVVTKIHSLIRAGETQSDYTGGDQHLCKFVGILVTTLAKPYNLIGIVGGGGDQNSFPESIQPYRAIAIVIAIYSHSHSHLYSHR